MGRNRPDSSESGSSSDDRERILGGYIDSLLSGGDVDFQEILDEHPESGLEIIEQLKVFREVGARLRPDLEEPLGTLGDYTLRRQIGRGGMGVVYEAWENSMDRAVALKVLPAAVAADSKAFMRFIREAKTAGQLNHQSIVHVHGLGLKEQTPYYAMELVDGETLSQILARVKDAQPEAETPFGPKNSAAYFDRLARAFADVADGLQHAHSRGVVHRDIKPSNLILDSGGTLRILDFGLARLEGQDSLTLSGDLMGTVLYMSPEQAMAKQIPLDHRTDVYSLGATMYETLTGQPPFKGKDQHDTLSQIIARDARAPRQVNPRLPKDFETIVLKCLMKGATDRYGTAEALAQDLRRFVRGDAIEARPRTDWQRLAGRLKSMKRAVALGVVLLVLLSLTGWLFYDREREELKRSLAEYESVVRRAVTLMHQGKFSLRPAREVEWDSRNDFRAWRSETVTAEELRSFWGMGRSHSFDAAVEELQEIATSLPEKWDAHYHLARAYALAGRHEEARDEIRRTLEQRPDFVPARVLALELAEGATGAAGIKAIRAEYESRPGWQRQWLVAFTSLQERRWRDAIDAYEQLLSGNGATNEPFVGAAMEAYMGRGLAYLEAGSYRKAREDFAVAESIAPVSLEPALLRAKACYLDDDPEEAEEILRRLYEGSGPDERSEAALLIGAVLHSLGLDDAALEWIEERLPERPLKERLRCFFLFRTGRTRAAIDSGTRAVGGNPRDPIAHRLLARALLEDLLSRRTPGELDLFLRTARTAVQLDGSNVLARRLLGAAESMNNDVEQWRHPMQFAGPTYALFSLALGLPGVAYSQQGFFGDVTRLEVSGGSDSLGSVSPDGRTLYFSSGREPSAGSYDFWTASREAGGSWSTPRRIEELSTGLLDGRLVVSSDERQAVYFRGQGRDGSMYMATRSDPDAPWADETHLIELDSTGTEVPGSFSSDGRRLYFSADRPVDDFGLESRGGMDIFVATRSTVDGPFEAVRNLQELNTSWDEAFPTLSPDGLTIFWSDYFPPSRGEGGSDIFMATRSSPDEPFGDPVVLGPPVNSEITDAAPWVSSDWPAAGSKLYFTRGVGPLDLWLYEATWHPDCNGNEVDDLVDIASGAPDVNRDGVPDECESAPRFQRGDCNGDSAVNIADATYLLNWLFVGEAAPGCAAATNTNGDDSANITDATYLLNHLFAGGPAPVAPFPDCGPGLLTADAALGCASPPDCQ